jgi:hypothetical protein
MKTKQESRTYGNSMYRDKENIRAYFVTLFHESDRYTARRRKYLITKKEFYTRVYVFVLSHGTLLLTFSSLEHFFHPFYQPETIS